MTPLPVPNPAGFANEGPSNEAQKELHYLPDGRVPVVVLISADAEWRAVVAGFPAIPVRESPMGVWFPVPVRLFDRERGIVLFHGGWGKIAAAASTQYVCDRWRPRLLVNLGTCGGIGGRIDRGAVVLAERTLVYDIYEQMGDADEHVAHYSTDVDLTWLSSNHPQPVVRGVLVSADRDLRPEDLYGLQSKYGAVAADWESGAIAFVAARNKVPCLILRGVSDLVWTEGGEVYDGTAEAFTEVSSRIVRALLDALPKWLEAAGALDWGPVEE